MINKLLLRLHCLLFGHNFPEHKKRKGLCTSPDVYIVFCLVCGKSKVKIKK